MNKQTGMWWKWIHWMCNELGGMNWILYGDTALYGIETITLIPADWKYTEGSDDS